jgi:N-acetylglucosaminylphosphatidylinositol deacetylase
MSYSSHALSHVPSPGEIVWQFIEERNLDAFDWVILFFVLALFVLLFIIYPRFYFFPKISKSRDVVLLVIAHPDDESMFYLPSIRAFKNSGYRIALLCLTNGNGNDSASKTRVVELYKAAKVLKIRMEHIRVVSLRELEDSMTVSWDPAVVAKQVANAVDLFKPAIILTFDQFGISGHKNHIDTFHGVKLFLKQVQSSSDNERLGRNSSKRKLLDDGVSSIQSKSSISGYSLDTVPIYRKFTGIFDLLPSILILYWKNRTSNTVDSLPGHVLVTLEDPSVPLKAMRAHESQWVWFRWLFVGFSRYPIMNSLSKIE